MEKVNLLSISVNTGSYTEFVSDILAKAGTKESNYTCVANVHTLVEAHNDTSFANVIRNASSTTPDGKPLAWALRMLYGIHQDRVAGMDLLPDLLRQSVQLKLPVYFYGGTELMLDQTRRYMRREYPGLVIAGCFSPPFRELTAPEEQFIINDINNSGTCLLFVILGCPKQEKWMASMQGRINAFMVGVGGALPVMIGTRKRAPRWMQNAGLEWSFRLLQEPNRLFKRYALTNSFFLYLLAREYIRLRLLRRRPAIDSSKIPLQ